MPNRYFMYKVFFLSFSYKLSFFAMYVDGPALRVNKHHDMSLEALLY